MWTQFDDLKKTDVEPNVLKFRWHYKSIPNVTELYLKVASASVMCVFTWYTHPLTHAVGRPRVPHVLRWGGVVWARRRVGGGACVPANTHTHTSLTLERRMALVAISWWYVPNMYAGHAVKTLTHLKKGFFKSRRLLDFDPVWSTWATILMS